MAACLMVGKVYLSNVVSSGHHCKTRALNTHHSRSELQETRVEKQLHEAAQPSLNYMHKGASWCIHPGSSAVLVAVRVEL